MKLRGLAVSLLLVGMEIAYAAAPRVIYPSTRVSVRPGGTSYTWTYGLADTPTQLALLDLADQDLGQHRPEVAEDGL